MLLRIQKKHFNNKQGNTVGVYNNTHSTSVAKVPNIYSRLSCDSNYYFSSNFISSARS